MAEKAVKTFNNLGGKTIQEHKKNFSLYMNELRSLSTPERENILNQLKAVHRQEEIFLVKLLLEFRQVDRLKTLILQGDRVLNKLITSHTPFILKDEKVDYFLNELFPNASFIVRHKCLHNLARAIFDENIGEEFFKKVLQTYGIRTAQILLPACRESFIKEIIVQYRVIFRDRQMVTLHKNFGQDFIGFYYDECVKYGWHHPFQDHSLFARYISSKDIKEFTQLLQYGMPDIGKRGFKRFVRENKEEFIENSNKYTFTKQKLVHKTLTRQEFRRYLLNKCPKSAEDFNVISFVDYLKPKSIKDRGTLLFSIFEEKYGYSLKATHAKNLFQRIGYFLKEVLSFEELLKFDMDDDEILEYLPPSKSFPLIKERINLTSDIYRRKSYIIKMFQSAKNYSEESLIEALEYCNHRHKNDEAFTKFDVFRTLKGMYKMEQLGANVWEILQQWIQLELLIDDRKRSSFLLEMLDEEFKYKFQNNLECLTIFKHCFRARSNRILNNRFPTLVSKKKELQRWIIDHFLEVAKEVSSENKELIQNWPHAFFSLLQAWNKDYPKEMISYYKYKEVVYLALEHGKHPIFMYVITYPAENQEEKELQDVVLNKCLTQCSSRENLWSWLLKHRVDVVEKYYHLYFDTYKSPVTSFLYELSKMHYTSLPEKFRTMSLQYLKESMEIFDKKESTSAVTNKQCLALKYLSNEKDFIDLLRDDLCFPSGEAEVEIIDKFSNNLYLLREQVVMCLQNRPSSQEVLPKLLRFCFKDYFHIALPVLTIALYNLPEKDLGPALQVLQDRSVSVRKKALFFGTIMGNAQLALQTLQFAGEHEKNKSLKKFIVNRSFKSFCSIGSEQSWELLNTHFKFVFENDSETQNTLLQFHLIPRICLHTYIENVWQRLGKLGNIRHGVLRAIKVDIMPLLSDELCENILQFCLGQSKDWVSSDVDFIYRYLLSGGEKMDHRLDLVAKNTCLNMGDGSEDIFSELSLKAHNIGFMYKDIGVRFMLNYDGKLEDKKLLVEKLIAKLPDLPLPFNRLDYQWQMEICRCYMNNLSDLPELIIKLLKGTLKEYGEAIQEYFNDFIASQRLMLGDVDNCMEFVLKLLDMDDSKEVKLLAIRLMPKEYPTSEVMGNKWFDLMDKIGKDATPVVQLFRKRYLKNVNVDYSSGVLDIYKAKRLRKQI